MTADWKDVRCASIPVVDLPVLADLRGRALIRVSIAGDRAWVWWRAESDMLREILVRRILPLSGAEVFAERGGSWYRLGRHLPAFLVPIGDGQAGVLLERLILPAPIDAAAPRGELPGPLCVRVVRDGRGFNRPASALRAPLDVLRAWAEQATSAQLTRLQGGLERITGSCRVGRRRTTRGTGARNFGIVASVAADQTLLGKRRARPSGLPRRAQPPGTGTGTGAGAGALDLAVLEEDGFELVARNVFKQLSRAAIRLAWEESQTAGPVERSWR